MAALIGIAAMGCAQERDAGSGPRSETRNERHETPGGGAVLRRLESVTWNPVTDELTWVVSAGSKSTGAYQPGATDTYRIHLESATMQFKGEGRHFREDEAERVHLLMDIISRYAVESTSWWEAGKSEKFDDKGNPVPDPKREDNKKATAHSYCSTLETQEAVAKQRSATGYSNVCSAALLQAKVEYRLVLRKCIRPCWSEALRARMQCAALSSHLVGRTWKTSSEYGF